MLNESTYKKPPQHIAQTLRYLQSFHAFMTAFHLWATYQSLWKTRCFVRLSNTSHWVIPVTTDNLWLRYDRYDSTAMAPAFPSWKNHIIIAGCDIGTPIAKLCVFFYSSRSVDLKIFEVHIIWTVRDWDGRRTYVQRQQNGIVTLDSSNINKTWTKIIDSLISEQNHKHKPTPHELVSFSNHVESKMKLPVIGAPEWTKVQCPLCKTYFQSKVLLALLHAKLGKKQIPWLDLTILILPWISFNSLSRLQKWQPLGAWNCLHVLHFGSGTTNMAGWKIPYFQ